MTRKLPSIISLIGPPGAGKGTYGALLAAHFPHSSFFSVGDVLREHSLTDSTLAAVLQRGGLVDDTLVDETVMQNLKDRFTAKGSDDDGMVILDGYPRTHAQAAFLARWPVGLRPSFAIHIDVPDEVWLVAYLFRNILSEAVRCGNIFSNLNPFPTNPKPRKIA